MSGERQSISHPFSMLFLFTAILLFVAVAVGLDNMYAGVPPRSCQQMASINLTMEAQGPDILFKGCMVEGCHVGCHNFDAKVKQFREQP